MKNDILITCNILKNNLIYDKDTGLFHKHLKNGKIIKSGCVQSCRGKKYIRIGLLDTSFSAHRLAWLYVYGEFPDGQIDHIDGDGLNNKICNLRVVTHIENSRNKRLCKNNTSGHYGVYWDGRRNKWRARIKTEMKLISLGSFSNKEDAIYARKNAEKNFNFHKNHGINIPVYEERKE